jgi:acetyl-CoA carboxylase biotin carboxyl carrier protein
MSLSYDEVAKIIKIVDASSLEELVIEVGDLRMSLSRRSAGEISSFSSAATVAIPTPADESRAEPERSRSPAIQKSTDDEFDIKDGVAVLAPMVGVFYSKPSPEAEPFVEVGSIVKEGDQLGLIEVMKLYTTIYAEYAGCVVKVLANEGDLVEYEQPLFVIEPR